MQYGKTCGGSDFFGGGIFVLDLMGQQKWLYEN